MNETLQFLLIKENKTELFLIFMCWNNMRNPSALFMALLSIGSFLFTYNFVSIIVNYKKTSNEKQNIFVMDPLVEMPEHAKRSRNHQRPFHVALTATDTPYSKWQCRIMYYWYNEKKDLPGSNMGKLTRILHSGAPDNLMDEIPTVVVDPLPPGLDRVRQHFLSYIAPLNRALS